MARPPAPGPRLRLRTAREDFGIGQLEALADGCALVTTPAPGPYVALPLARALDPASSSAKAALPAAIRTALDDPVPGSAARAAPLLAPYATPAVDRLVADRLLPAFSADRGLARCGRACAAARTLFHGSVLATSAGPSHARRAVATPQRTLPSVLRRGRRSR